jgi:hypothetical protein
MLHARLRLADVMPTATARQRLADAVAESCAIESHLRALTDEQVFEISRPAKKDQNSNEN